MTQGRLWFLLGLLAGLLHAYAALPGIAPASDLWDYSQEARQLARGHGFTSLYTYPCLLDGDSPPFPVRWRMPLYAAIGALLLRLGIALPAGFLYFGALVHAFLVALTYLLGARFASPRAGAWAATGALACPLLLDFYNPGMSQTPAAALGLGVWLLLLRGGVGASLLAGIAAAAAWYLRGESILFVPLWALVAARPSTARSRSALAFMGAWAIACLPWFLASCAGGGTIQGNPMLLYTAEYPGYSSSRTLNVHLPGMLAYVFAHPGAFAFRFAKDVAGYAIDLATGIGPLAIVAAIAGVIVSRGAAVVTRRTVPLLAAVALQILAMSALERSPRFLVPVVPIVLVLLAALAGPILERSSVRRFFALAVVALIVERGAHTVWERGDALRRFPPVAMETAPVLLDRARTWRADGWVLSDAPDWISWQLDRPALLLPMSAQLDSLVAARPVAAIWLSPGARWRNVADRDTGWVTAIDRNDGLPGFSGPEALPGGSRLYVIK